LSVTVSDHYVTFDNASKLVSCSLQAFIGVCRVEASATLKLHMIRFENPTENDYGGSCCDVFCNDCDHQFRFSLDDGNRSIVQYFTSKWCDDAGIGLAMSVGEFNSWPERYHVTTMSIYFTQGLGLLKSL